MSTSIPILRMHIEGLHDQVAMMLKHWVDEHGNAVQQVIAQATDEESIREMLRFSVNTTIREIVKKEIEAHFRYGPGRDALEEACRKELDLMFGKDRSDES